MGRCVRMVGDGTHGAGMEDADQSEASIQVTWSASTNHRPAQPEPEPGPAEPLASAVPEAEEGGSLRRYERVRSALN